MNVTLFQNNGYVYTEQQQSFYNEQQRESVGTSLFTYIEMALVR